MEMKDMETECVCVWMCVYVCVCVSHSVMSDFCNPFSRPKCWSG